MRTVLVVLPIAVVLASCSAGGEQPADAGAALGSSAESGLSTPSGSKPADDPIPPVRNPKNLTAIPPCLLVTPSQLDANRIDQPGQPKDALGSGGCEWTDKAHTREFAVFIDIGNDVLRNVYSQRDSIPVLEVTQVAGQPAIRTKDDANSTSCYFRVAAAETQTLIVRYTGLGQGREDPCIPAKAFAETVIGNLPPLTG